MAKLPESMAVAVNCPACGDPIGLRFGLEMVSPTVVEVTGDDAAIREHVAARHPDVAAAAAVSRARDGAP